MELKKRVQQDLSFAIREKKKEELSVLRLLNSAIINQEKEKRYKKSKENPELGEQELERKSQLTEEEILEIISREVKKRKESVLAFKKGLRKDLVQKEEAEIEILRRYLPEQLPDQEIEKLAKEAIEKLGVKEMKDMGGVMKELMPKIKGRAEGGKVSQIVRQLLSK